MNKRVFYHMVEISPAHVPSHAGVLAEVHGEAFADAWDADAFASALAQPGAFGFIAVDEDDEPLGFVLLRAVVFDAGGEAEVLTIATRPQRRRQGVARQLMTTALTAAIERGVTRVFLDVAQDNAPARALYDDLGFGQVGRRKAYYARGKMGGENPRVDALVMALDVGV